MFSYFIYNGIHSRDMGVYLSAPPPIMRGKERLIMPYVPGRGGTLTQTEGEDVYEPYTVQLVLRAREPISKIIQWLRGDGYVTFSGEPDRRQQARVVAQSQFKKISKNLSYWEGTVAFYCQPYKEALYEEEHIVQNGSVITNLGDVTERPVFTLDGAYGDFAVGVGDRVLAVTGLDRAVGGCVIDCDANCILSFDRTQLITNLSAGEFPYLPVGQSTLDISGSHVGTVTVGRRQRWL